jgi:hypothetical protein
MTLLPLDDGGLSASLSHHAILASESVQFNFEGGSWAKSCDENIPVRTFGGLQVSSMTIAGRQHGELRQRILSKDGNTIFSVKTVSR